jgi:hypothetical protein
MNIKNIFMFIIRMDISGNLNDIMFQYNKNMRDYNDNMRLYLDIIANRERINAQNRRYDYTYYYNQPVRPANILSSLFFPTTRSENTLQDVIVRPTQEQIQDATEIISFDKNISNNNTNCPITLEPFVNGEQVCRIKHCSHLFKQNALNDWFRRNVRCPVCRYDIRDYVNEDSDRELDENEENEYLEMVEELLNDTTETQRQNPSRQHQNTSTQNMFTRTLTSAIRGFVNNELSRLPTDFTSAASELLYTFDIPISVDISGNLRI